MADKAVIGALKVILGGDTKELNAALKESQLGVAAFAGAVGGAMAVVADKVIGAVGHIASALGKTIEDMDKLNKESQKLGIPVEQLSALAYAADLSDVSFGSLSKGVGKLSKAMVEAAAKPTSEAANAFKALGVSVTDSGGKLKSSQEVMGSVADKFEGLKDGAGKTAVAMALFGKAGADLIPLLNGGRDGLQEMNDEAKQFGAIVSTQSAKQAEVFNDNLTKLGYAVKGIIVQTASQLLPTLVNVSTAFVEWAKTSTALETALNVVSNAMKGLVTGGVLVGAVFKTIAEYISTVSTSLGLLVKGEFSKAWERIQTGVSGVAETAKGTFTAIDDLWRGATTGAAAAASATDGAAKSQKDFNYAALAGKNAVDQFIGSQMKGLASQQAEIQTFGMLAGAREAAKIQLQALAVAKQNDTNISATQQAQLDLLKQKTSDYAMTLAGLQMTQSNLTPAQLFQQEQAKIQALFDAGKISAETYGQAMDNVAQRANATWGQVGESMAGSFAKISAAFGKESKGMATAAKVFGVIQGTISMFTGAAKALELPFPANLAAMAAVLAQGASLVASIKSQAIPSGMAMGGAFRVPGGIGGGDKVPFHAMLEPGELVEVSSNRPGGYQSGGDRGSRSSGGTVMLQIDAALRPLAEALIPQFNAAMRDGHELKLAPA
jgi:hypothetical protein